MKRPAAGQIGRAHRRFEPVRLRGRWAANSARVSSRCGTLTHLCVARRASGHKRAPCSFHGHAVVDECSRSDAARVPYTSARKPFQRLSSARDRAIPQAVGRVEGNSVPPTFALRATSADRL